MPRVLWLSIVCLAVLVLGRVWLSTRLGSVVMLDAAAWAVVLFGLIAGRRWAFYLAIALPALELVLLSIRAGPIGAATLAVNALVVVPTVAGREYFFGARTPCDEP
jgi:hypothetical protein